MLDRELTQDDLGKYFRTRGGEKVCLTGFRVQNPFTDEVIEYPIIVSFEHGKEMFLTTNGYRISSRTISIRDIVAEWKEPREWWVNIYEEGPSILQPTKKEADESCTPQRIACIKVTEGEGL